jgi:hypothetical protein
MCEDEAILLEDNSINQSTYKPGEEFNVILQVFNLFVFKII